VLFVAAAMATSAAVASWLSSRPAPTSPTGLEPVADEASHVAAPEVGSATLLAAGDIAECTGSARRTGALLARETGAVAPLGDLAYPDGSPDAFRSCYGPAWGSVRDRTRPAQGNHDVMTQGAAGYYAYFGAAAGPRPQGYYSYDLGAWHIVVLNSNCDQVGGCDAESPQIAWLQRDLAATSTGNILAYWHHPRFSTGAHGDDDRSADFWRVLDEAGADVVLNGHDHDYQRFTPVAANGESDPRGIRQFVVGTGGAGLRDFSGPAPPTLEFRQNSSHGILRLDLDACGYRWAFLPTDGPAVDEGSAGSTC